MPFDIIKSDVISHLDAGKNSVNSSDLIVHYLEKIGVEYVFGIPGGAIEPFYDALARSMRRGGPRPIIARHEAGSAFMADGYTRQTGRLGVCCATTGPGSTNLITGIACAYENDIPMLVITAQTPLPTFGKGAFQESSCTGIDTVGMFQYCTRYNSLVSHVDQLKPKLLSAIMTAYGIHKGPCHLSIPLDVLRQPVSEQDLELDITKLLRRRVMTDAYAVSELSNAVSDARHIVLVLGGGCGEAIGAILEFAEVINASIITTPHGKGFISAKHPRYAGVIGFAGHQSAYNVLSNSNTDLIIAIETNFGEWSSSGWDERLLNTRLVHVDSSCENLTRSPIAKLHINGDILATFEQLLDVYKQNPHPSKMPLNLVAEKRETTLCFQVDEEDKYYSDTTPIKPQRLMKELSELFPANTRYLADTGNSVAWAVHYLQPFDRRSSNRRSINGGLFRTSIEFATMGWAIGAAVGTSLGYLDGPVVCITGDGSFLMSGQELTVAVAERLSIVFIVLNDHALGMVKHGQRLTGAEQVGFELPAVDFSAMAKAQGAEAFTIHSPEDLHTLDIKAICSRQGPTLLDIHIDPEEVPPMKVRMKGLVEAK